MWLVLWGEEQAKILETWRDLVTREDKKEKGIAILLIGKGEGGGNLFKKKPGVKLSPFFES